LIDPFGGTPRPEPLERLKALNTAEGLGSKASPGIYGLGRRRVDFVREGMIKFSKNIE